MTGLRLRAGIWEQNNVNNEGIKQCTYDDTFMSCPLPAHQQTGSGTAVRKRVCSTIHQAPEYMIMVGCGSTSFCQWEQERLHSQVRVPVWEQARPRPQEKWWVEALHLLSQCGSRQDLILKFGRCTLPHSAGPAQFLLATSCPE